MCCVSIRTNTQCTLSCSVFSLSLLIKVIAKQRQANVLKQCAIVDFTLSRHPRMQSQQKVSKFFRVRTVSCQPFFVTAQALGPCGFSPKVFFFRKCFLFSILPLGDIAMPVDSSFVAIPALRPIFLASAQFYRRTLWPLLQAITAKLRRVIAGGNFKQLLQCLCMPALSLK